MIFYVLEKINDFIIYIQDLFHSVQTEQKRHSVVGGPLRTLLATHFWDLTYLGPPLLSTSPSQSIPLLPYLFYLFFLFRNSHTSLIQPTLPNWPITDDTSPQKGSSMREAILASHRLHLSIERAFNMTIRYPRIHSTQFCSHSEFLPKFSFIFFFEKSIKIHSSIPNSIPSSPIT